MYELWSLNDGYKIKNNNQKKHLADGPSSPLNKPLPCGLDANLELTHLVLLWRKITRKQLSQMLQ
jgi:hypothetical protein